MTEEAIREIRKRNMKLYPFYIMFGYDLLFFYGIKVLFLSEVKGMTNAQIMLSSSLYAVFTIMMQFPSSIIDSKIGRKNTAVLGNIINLFSIIMFMALKTFNGLVIAQLISAIAFAFKSISEANLLTISIPESEDANDIFTSIDKKGYARYCILSAFATIASGWLYRINPYLPIFFCLISAIIATILSLNFGDIEKYNKEKTSLKEYVKELKKGYKFTINSKRLRALLLATGIVWGVVSLADTYQLALLQGIGVSSVEITLIYALYEISKAIFSLKAPEFNKRFRNKSITNILAVFSFCMIICGIIAIMVMPLGIKVAIIVVLILTMGALNGTSQILSKKYLNSFTNEKILTCIYSAKGISDNVSKTLITGVGSFILTVAQINVAIVIAGLALIVITFLLSMYMETRVGLSPDEYTQKDIYIR